MPMIDVRTNCTITPGTEKTMKTQIGEAIALLPGKTENYLMLAFSDNEHLWFAGQNTPAAMIDVTAFGTLAHEDCCKLTERLTTIVADALKIPSARIYVKYASTREWGWQGHQF